MDKLIFNIQDTFNKELPADENKINTRRQVINACYSYVLPKKPDNPSLIHVSDEMLSNIGLSSHDAQSEEFLKIFSGSEVLKGTDPYAMCYGGHQFGHWAGQLGDGRAINLFEVIHNENRWALQLKGAGETPYSRSADGLAVLRSSIREHLCSEAMHHLGVPTTRSLALMLSGEMVLRDVMYDGNAAYEKGAIVTRVAPTFLRFGNYQMLMARNDLSNLKKLVDYTIKYFYPSITTLDKNGYLEFFRLVTQHTLNMIVDWQRVGFVHGVMNTDNMSILGLTIDYGPYGWLEGYDPEWTPNTTDKDGRRYRFGNQPKIGQWNLYQLANALFPLIEESKPLEDILNQYSLDYADAYHEMMKSKLGLELTFPEDRGIIKALERTLVTTETDMTIFFRSLSHFQKDITDASSALNIINPAFYAPDEIKGDVQVAWTDWLEMYLHRLTKEVRTDTKRKVSMDVVNPKYVLRNYMAQIAIDAADKGDYSVIDELYQMLKQPYNENTHYEKWYAKRPEWARDKIGCSMLSCSS